MQKPFVLVRGHLLSVARNNTSLEEIRDGGLLIDDKGSIVKAGEFFSLQKDYPSAAIRDHSGSYILPSFFDTHIHFPQLDMIGSCAEELLLWLQRYTFPREAAFRGKNDFVRLAATHFVDELVSNGTTTAVVYSSSCGDATDLLFEEFERRGIRGIIGKTSMDRHCPPEIAVDTQKDREWTDDLIKRWHGKDERLFYALTPRFAPSCSHELMTMLSDMHKTYPSVYMQTHYAENKNEIAWVKELFPESQSYLDVYDTRGLLGDKTILAHSIHTNEDDEKRLLERRVVICHCPTSNLFLGSGLFQTQSYIKQGQRVTLGTDVGAGTTFSLWQTMNEAYKVAQLRGERISPAQLLALATVSSAEALGFTKLGRLEAGYSADYQVIDGRTRGILDRHLQLATSSDERLAALIHFTDDRCLTELRVQGRQVYHRR